MTKKKQYPWASDAERAAVVVPDTRSPAEKRLHQLIEAESVPEVCGSDYSQALYKAALKLAAPVQAPLFWYRPCSNGMYEGPIHNAQIEDVRKQSGAWVPLVSAISSLPATPVQEPVVWRIMARLADLLDEDQFNEIEGMVTSAGYKPPAAQPESDDLDRKACEELNCAEEVLAGLSVDLDMEQTHFDCIGDYIQAVFDAQTKKLTTPPAAPLPQPFPQEAAAFKAWFDARWLGDGEMGEAIPSQSDPQFPTYMNEYTLGFGAWMAAKHAAHGIKKGGAA